MNQLQPQVRETLIAIGQAVLAGEVPNLAEIESIGSYDEINRQRPEFWQEAVTDLPDKKVANLACGLAYVETQFRWLGGSVSGVIWLFRALTCRNASTTLLDEVSGWILTNTMNPYNPFGTQVSLGARNYSEYRKLSSARAIEIGKCIEKDAKAENLAKAERQLRRKMAAAGADARSTEVRVRIIESMNSLNLTEKLEKISSDPTYPPQFFPTSIADAATQEVVDALPREVQVELARRLKGKRRGPWGKFSKRLMSSLGPIWNKQPWRI